MKYLLIINIKRNKKQKFNFYFHVFVLAKFDNNYYKCDYKIADEKSYKKTLNSIIKKYNPTIVTL